MNKLGDLTALREADKPDIIAIIESFLDDVIGDSEISDSSYCVFRRDRNRHGGGVMLLIKSTICATRRAYLEGDFELLWIEISHSRGVFLLGVFYRPPVSSSEYLYNLQNSLARIPDSQTIILCGDFNVPDVDWDLNVPTTSSSLAKLLCDITFNSSLFQLVTEATRNSNMLDLVFVNYSERVKDVTVVDGIPGSDHDGICFNISVDLPPIRRVPHRRLFNFKKADFGLFRDVLSSIPWDCCFRDGDVEEACTKFKDLFFAVADQCIPSFTLKRKRTKSWLSDEVLTLIRR